MGVSWIEHNGKKILYVDYSQTITSVQMIKILYEYIKVLEESPGKITSLVNFENSYISREFMEKGKQLGQEYHKRKIKKNALLGINRVKRIFVKAYLLVTKQNNVKTFNTIEEALIWLTK